MPELALFLVASFALTIAPGPDNMQVLARGISQGRAAGVTAALGFAAGCLFHTTLAAVGLAAALRSSAVAFQLIKLGGGVYLIWIGLQALRSRGSFSLAGSAPARKWAIFRQSVLGNMMNPKVTLFFLVFLPQFVNRDAGRPEWQMMLLGLVFMLQTVVIFGAIGLGAGLVGGWLQRRPRAGLWLNRLAGATFVGLGVRAALPD
ncbi:MAG: lysine transporter LysE [Betaproteobacteria bacterium RIFCSPLOWO2_12_FULL_66_14]|nr:MAG: lysine transporter LysE [Betaproteobacteria bacterium RIFCSPLOWO2_12_FULL_66_14]